MRGRDPPQGRRARTASPPREARSGRSRNTSSAPGEARGPAWRGTSSGTLCFGEVSRCTRRCGPSEAAGPSFPCRGGPRSSRGGCAAASAREEGRRRSAPRRDRGEHTRPAGLLRRIRSSPGWSRGCAVDPDVRRLDPACRVGRGDAPHRHPARLDPFAHLAPGSVAQAGEKLVEAAASRPIWAFWRGLFQPALPRAFGERAKNRLGNSDRHLGCLTLTTHYGSLGI